MHTDSIHYSRPIIPDFFKGVSHEELKWTINYLMGLLEKPESKVEEPSADMHEESFSPRINKLLSIPKRDISTEIKKEEGSQLSISEAKSILSQRKLKSHNVPADFNGMRDEVNPKFL